MSRARWWVAPGVALVLVLAWSEVVHARAGRKRLGSSAGAAGSSEVVVAFGLRNRSQRANLLNRYRVRVALRSRREESSRSQLVFSGGSTSPGWPPEAVLMAEHAQRLGALSEDIEVATASRTTWENVLNVTPILEGAGRIVFASNAVHAEKARAYLWLQRPDLAARLARADDHRLGELLLLKPLLAWIGIRDLRRLASP